MTRLLLLSVQIILRNLDKVGRKVAHFGESLVYTVREAVGVGFLGGCGSVNYRKGQYHQNLKCMGHDLLRLRQDQNDSNGEGLPRIDPTAIRNHAGKTGGARSRERRTS